MIDVDGARIANGIKSPACERQRHPRTYGACIAERLSALGASKICLVSGNPTCSVPALYSQGCEGPMVIRLRPRTTKSTLPTPPPLPTPRNSHLLASLVLQDIKAPHPVHPHAVPHEAVQHAGQVDISERRPGHVGRPQRPQQLTHQAPDQALRKKTALLQDEPLGEGLGSRVVVGHEEQGVAVKKRLFLWKPTRGRSTPPHPSPAHRNAPPRPRVVSQYGMFRLVDRFAPHRVV